MTIFLRDMSHYDGNESLAGFVGTTHKVTEGTSYVDGAYAARLNRYRAAGVQVLGSYHVLHTGNLAAQLDHWLSTLDALTPWWRGFPHWVMQVDAERWPADNVSPDTVKAFARLLVDSGCPGWKVTYASRGQYGSALAGLATPLWNAAYHSSTYPGDGAGDWAPYSGKAPVLWQYTSTPFDKSAFRGSLDELLTLIGGNDMDADQSRKLDNCERILTTWAEGKKPFGVKYSLSDPGRTLGDPFQAIAPTLTDAQVTSLAQQVAPLVAAQMPKPPTAAEVAEELAKRLGNG